MEPKKENTPFDLLELIRQSAFCVENGQITRVNEAARHRTLEVGTAIDGLLLTGRQEYREFNEGQLYLTLCIAGSPCNACVTRGDGMELFVVEPTEKQSQLQSMALAAQELRLPLSGVLLAADQLFPSLGGAADPAAQALMSRINRGLYQLQRLIGNMSDAYQYAAGISCEMETRDICAVMDEIFENAARLTGLAGCTLRYRGLNAQQYCLLDMQMLERAVLNLLSNALKFSPKGTVIDVWLRRRGSKLYLTIQDGGPGIPDAVRSNVFSRYLREPSIEDGRYGIGLGLLLVQAVASAHGGTVLLEQPKGAGTRVTMTLALRTRQEDAVYSPLYTVDYGGDRDHGLIELSESLPEALYLPKNIN